MNREGFTPEQAQALVDAGMTEEATPVVMSFLAQLLAGDEENEPFDAAEAVAEAIEAMPQLVELA